MSDDVVPAVIATSLINQPEMQNSLRQMAVEQRRQAISDMFGIKPMSPWEYKQEHKQPIEIIDIVLWSVVGLAIGLAAGALISGATAAVLLGILGGLAGGAIEPMMNNSRAMEGYGNYLSDFAARARDAHDMQQAKSVAAEVEKAPQKPAPEKPQPRQWAEDVTAAREKPVAAGVVQH